MKKALNMLNRYSRKGNCKLCGRFRFISVRRKCNPCADKNMDATYRAIRLKKGKTYEKWKAGMLAGINRQ